MTRTKKKNQHNSRAVLVYNQSGDSRQFEYAEDKATKPEPKSTHEKAPKSTHKKAVSGALFVLATTRARLTPSASITVVSTLLSTLTGDEDVAPATKLAAIKTILELPATDLSVDYQIKTVLAIIG